MKLSCWFLCVSLVFLSACKRKRVGAPAAPDTSAASAAEQPAAVPSSPAAQAPATASPVPVEPAATFDERFSLLTQGLLTFKRDKQRAPRDWQELITTGYLKQMPDAPPGKRYIFNPGSLDVHMVNQ